MLLLLLLLVMMEMVWLFPLLRWLLMGILMLALLPQQHLIGLVDGVIVEESASVASRTLLSSAVVIARSNETILAVLDDTRELLSLQHEGPFGAFLHFALVLFGSQHSIKEVAELFVGPSTRCRICGVISPMLLLLLLLL